MTAPDLAARLRNDADRAEDRARWQKYQNDADECRREAERLRAAADIVEAHQRLLDAIGDPDDLAEPHEWETGDLHRFVKGIRDAVDGAS